jgi:hypothetical protein
MAIVGLIIFVIGVFVILFTDDSDDPAQSYKIHKYFQGGNSREENADDL